MCILNLKNYCLDKGVHRRLIGPAYPQCSYSKILMGRVLGSSRRLLSNRRVFNFLRFGGLKFNRQVA
ncbi:MAG TPA: hypothetical protein DCK87_00120 [Desulfotomaculum sp.]|nr:hypothetical protein [Desulfotomaculum sp.]